MAVLIGRNYADDDEGFVVLSGDDLNSVLQVKKKVSVYIGRQTGKKTLLTWGQSGCWMDCRQVTHGAFVQRLPSWRPMCCRTYAGWATCWRRHPNRHRYHYKGKVLKQVRKKPYNARIPIVGVVVLVGIVRRIHLSVHCHLKVFDAPKGQGKILD